MKTNNVCDNCHQNQDFLQDVIHTIIPRSDRESPSSSATAKQDPVSNRLPINEALSSITCTLWGDPVSAESSDIGPLEGLELCSNCTELLSQLYNNLREFRHLCREQGRVFNRILELRKIRRKQETVVAVVKLERLPPSSTECYRPLRITDDEGILEPDPSSISDVDNEGIEVKEEPVTDSESVDDNYLNWSNGETYSTAGGSDEEEIFGIRPDATAFSSCDPALDSDLEEAAQFHKKRRKGRPTSTRRLRTRPPIKPIVTLKLKDVSVKGEETSKKRPSSPKFPCTVDGCEKSYYGRRQLARHVQEKHNRIKKDKFVDCSQCGKAVSKYYLPSHMKVMHSNEKSCLCDHCGMAYGTKASLTRHILNLHSGRIPERKFPCSQCALKFYRLSHLQDHIAAIHEWKDPSTCEVCGRQFMHERSLKQHLKTHDEEAKRQLECQLCHAMFGRKDSLQHHIKTAHEGIKYKKRTLEGPKRKTLAKVLAVKSGQIQDQPDSQKSRNE